MSCSASNYSLFGGRRKKRRSGTRKKRPTRGGNALLLGAPALSLLALNQYLHKTMGRKHERKSHRRRSFRR